MNRKQKKRAKLDKQSSQSQLWLLFLSLICCHTLLLKTCQAACTIIKLIDDNSALATDYYFNLNSGNQMIAFDLTVVCKLNSNQHDPYPLQYSVMTSDTPPVNLMLEDWMSLQTGQFTSAQDLVIDTNDAGLLAAGPQTFSVGYIQTFLLDPPLCDIINDPSCSLIAGTTTSFKIHFQAVSCATATLDSFVLTNMSHTVFDATPDTQAIPVLSTDVETADPTQNCGIRKYTLTSIDNPTVDLTPFLSIVTAPSLQIKLLSNQMADISNPFYGARLTVQLNDWPLATLSYANFKVYVLDPCPGTTLQPTNVSDMTDTAMNNAAVTQTVQLTDSISLAQDGGGEGYLTCAPQSYSLQNIPLIMAGKITISNNVISVNSDSAAQLAGSPYTITLRSSILGGSLYIDETFVVTLVDQCASTVIDINDGSVVEIANDGSSASVTLTYTDTVGVTNGDPNFCGDKTFNVPEFAGEAWFASSTTLPQTITFVITEPAIANLGTYNWTIVVGLASGLVATKTSNLTIEIKHPCFPTVFDPTNVADMTQMVLHNSIVTQTVLMTDSVSTARDPNSEGYIFCGDRSYSLVNAPSFLSLVGDEIRLQSNALSNLNSSPYTVTLRSELATDYGQTTQQDETFVVTITPCPITSVVASPASLGPYTYVFDDPKGSVNYPTFTITPDCNYAPSWSRLTTPSPYYIIIDIDPFDWEYHTSNILLNGQSFTVTLVATFPDANQFTHQFPIDFNVVDPCPNTAFDPSDVGNCPNINISVNGGTQTRTLNPNLWEDDESDDRYNGDGYTLCGPRTLTIDSAYTALSFTSTDLANYKYSAGVTSTADPSGQEQSLTGFTCTMCLQNYPSICHTQTFDVNVSECSPNPHQKVAASYPNRVYTMFYDTTPLQIPKTSFEQAPCNFVETITCLIDGSAIPNTWIIESATELIVSTEDQSLHGMYTIACTSSLTSSSNYSKTESFTLNMVDPCTTSVFNAGYYVPSDLNVAVMSTGSNSWTDAQYQDKVNEDIGLVKNLGALDQSTCGPKTYTFNEVGLARHSKPTANSLQLAPTATSEVGTHTCSLTIELTNYGASSTCKMTQTFACNVLPCTINTLTQTAPIPNQYYIIADSQLTINFPFATYVQSPNCGATATMTDQTTPGMPVGMTLVPASSYTVQTDDLSQVGTYTIVYRATFDDASNKVLDITFDIAYDDPCDGTQSMTANTLTPAGVTDMTTSILFGQPVTQDITTNDWASTTYGNQDGVTLCGDRSYTIMSGSGAWVSLTTTTATDDTISFQTNDFGLTPITTSTSYALQIRVCLTNYPTTVPCILYNLNLIVEPCKIVTYTPDSTIATQTYTIWYDALAPFPVAYPSFTQVPACNYTPTITTTVDANALNPTTHPYLTQQDANGQYDVFEQDIARAGTYAIILTSTLDDLYHVATTGTANSDTTWNLQLINPCSTATVNTNLHDASQEYTMVDMQTTVKVGSPVTQTFVSFQDSVSQRFGATYVAGDPLQGTDICGPRTYNFIIDSTPSSSFAWFSFDITTGTISVETALDADIKYAPQGYQVDIQVCLDNYASVCSPTQTFFINIEECRLTNFAISVPQPDQDYKIFDSQNTHALNAYVQTPLCGYTLSYGCQLVGAGSLSYINYDCLNVNLPSTNEPLSLATLADPLNPTFGIESAQHVLAGSYTVTQSVTVPGYRYTADSLHSLSDSWTLLLEDPCFSSIIEPQTAIFAPDPLIETSVKLGTDLLLPYSDANIGTETKFAFQHFGDTESTIYTQPGQPPVCRDRSYQIQILDHQFQPGDPVNPYVAPAGGLTFIYLDQSIPELNVHTNLDQFIGYYTVKLSIWLTYYPVVNDVQNFKVRIWPCLVNSLTLDAPLTTLNPFTFEMYQAQVTIPFQPYTQAPLCGYPYTYAISLTNGNPLPSFATIGTCLGTSDPCSIAFQSAYRFDDLCDYGYDDDADPSTPKINPNTCMAGNENPYPFLLTATLAPSPTSSYFNPQQASVLTTNTQGTLNVWPKDICMDATLLQYDPDSHDDTKNMYNFIYQPQWNQYQFETTQDTISLDSVNNLVDGTGYDLCGPRYYFVENGGGAFVAYAKVDQTDEPPLVEYQSSQWYMKGLRSVNFRTQLAWYPHIQEIQTLKVSFYGLYETQTLTEKYHQIGGEVTEFTFLPFSIDPNDGRWDVDYEVEHKRQASSTFIAAPSWITYDPLTQTVSIQTSNTAHEGKWHLRIKASIRQHPTNTALGAQFLVVLSKDAPPVQVTNPPFFEESIQEFFSYQYDLIEKWDYALPEMKDPEGDLPTCKMLGLPPFIIYDSKAHKLSLLPGLIDKTKIGDHEIKFHLVDASGAVSEDYVIVFQITDKPTEFNFEDFLWNWSNNQEEAYEVPKPSVKNFNRKGKIFVTWNIPMRRPRKLKTIKDETCEWFNPQTEQIEIKPAMEVNILRGAYSLESNINFRWELENWQSKSFEIQLYFDEPLVITTFVDPEKLLVIFYCEDFFRDKFHNIPIKGGPNLKEDSVLFDLVPEQIEILTQAQEEAQEERKATTQIFNLLNFVANLLLSASLNQLWSMINTQQIIVLIPLFNLKVPVNANLFFTIIMQVAAFDIIPTDDIYAAALGLSDVDPPDALTDNFETVGFETIWSVFNLGSLGLAVLSFPFFVCVDTILRLLAPKVEKARKWSAALEKKLYWNTSLRILIESYTIMTVCCLIHLTDLTWGSYGEAVMSCFALAGTVIVTAFPFVSSAILLRNWDKIEGGDKDFQERFGALWEGIDTSKGKQVIWYQHQFLLRRLIIGFAVVASRETLIWQLIQLVAQCVFGIIVVGQFQPMENRKSNKQEYFNEMMILIVTYTFFCFSPWGPDDLEIRTTLGQVAIGGVAFHIGYNLFQMGYETIRLNRLKITRWHLSRKYAKIRAEKIYVFEKKLRHKKFKQQKQERRQKLTEKDESRKQKALIQNIKRFGDIYTKDLSRAPKPEGADFSSRETRSRMPNVPPPLNLRPKLKLQKEANPSKLLKFNPQQDIVLPSKMSVQNQILPQKFDNFEVEISPRISHGSQHSQFSSSDSSSNSADSSNIGTTTKSHSRKTKLSSMLEEKLKNENELPKSYTNDLSIKDFSINSKNAPQNQQQITEELRVDKEGEEVLSIDDKDGILEDSFFRQGSEMFKIDDDSGSLGNNTQIQFGTNLRNTLQTEDDMIVDIHAENQEGQMKDLLDGLSDMAFSQDEQDYKKYKLFNN